jgi:dTDP-glucose 4,6-dehydratase
MHPRVYALLDLLDTVRPQVVINVAARSEVALSHERPEEYFATNTLGAVQLCHHLRRQSYLERYVHISSAEIFGSCTQPLNEDALYNPNTPYAVSKAAADGVQEVVAGVEEHWHTIVHEPHEYIHKYHPRQKEAA